MLLMTYRRQFLVAPRAVGLFFFPTLVHNKIVELFRAAKQVSPEQGSGFRL